MIRGPCEYVPPVTVEVVQTRRAIPLDKNEGIYIRDTQTGKVRAHCGSTYMLNEHEELWKKDLPGQVELLLGKNRDPVSDRTGFKKAVKIVSTHVYTHTQKAFYRY